MSATGPGPSRAPRTLRAFPHHFSPCTEDYRSVSKIYEQFNGQMVTIDLMKEHCVEFVLVTEVDQD